MTEFSNKYVNEVSKLLHTQYSVRMFHKYGFDKDLESHGRGREVSGAWLDTFVGLLVPTGDGNSTPVSVGLR